MDTNTLSRFEQTYAEALPKLSTPWRAAEAPAPELVVLNEPVARELGLDPDELRSPEGVAFLVGRVPDEVETVAQVYAGHQFGGYSPRLGDGRALLVGELTDAHGRRRDLHLKGSGRTPFARGGDGKAVIGPMLREYLISEAMHALGIPTTRSLAVVRTGESVFREGPQPGAVLSRVAASHLRVGTFEYAAALRDPELLRGLADYAIERHHPEARAADNPYLEFYRRVMRAQAALIVDWMGVGFIHGVMNTDNVTISGETIDYGPCAFMDAFDPGTVFSSIDTGGRYAYGNQPSVGQWNLARFGEALLPLFAPDEDAAIELAMEVLTEFGTLYNELALERMSAKLGLARPDAGLVEAILGLLHRDKVDFTNFFRALAAGTAEGLFTDRAVFAAWAEKRASLLPADPTAVHAAMDALNPAYIPRNHRVEEALLAAQFGNLEPFDRLLTAVQAPFEVRAGLEDLAEPDPDEGRGFRTFCGT
ncbi:protein adenylyltransferase SelO [Granulicoccus sp. GXG6511]|uniref:protein adenylyltransferase SelO n=1 Tax=Granulicoccus sp. GXG6511 TaxID=3381351 RepID=UPI003D7E7149